MTKTLTHGKHSTGDVIDCEDRPDHQSHAVDCAVCGRIDDDMAICEPCGEVFCPTHLTAR